MAFAVAKMVGFQGIREQYSGTFAGVDFMYTKHHHDQNLKPLHSRDIPQTIQEICAAMHLSSKGLRLQPLLGRWCV